MKRCIRILFPTVVSVLLLMVGCSTPPVKIIISHSFPARYEIPPSIKRLAIVPFVAKKDSDTHWAEYVSADLTKTLKQQDRIYEVLDHVQTARIMKEHGIKRVSGPVSALKLGKLAQVNAVLYGTVSVITSDKPTLKQFELSGCRVCCRVNVELTLDGVDAGRTLAAVSFNPQSYWSASGKPVVTIEIQKLLEQCVAEFVSEISPRQSKTVVVLETGNAKIIEEGNDLASSGAYNKALKKYLAAIEKNNRSHEAVFNAAVMYEALKQFKQASEMYEAACKIKSNPKYSAACERVSLKM